VIGKTKNTLPLIVTDDTDRKSKTLPRIYADKRGSKIKNKPLKSGGAEEAEKRTY
jgi:hypothetical protein